MWFCQVFVVLFLCRGGGCVQQSSACTRACLFLTARINPCPLYLIWASICAPPPSLLLLLPYFTGLQLMYSVIAALPGPLLPLYIFDLPILFCLLAPLLLTLDFLLLWLCW